MFGVTCISAGCYSVMRVTGEKCRMIVLLWLSGLSMWAAHASECVIVSGSDIHTAANGLYVRDDSLSPCSVDPSMPRYVHQYGHRFLFYSKIANWENGWYIGNSLCETKDKSTMDIGRFSNASSPDLVDYWFSQNSAKTYSAPYYGISVDAETCPAPVSCVLLSNSADWPQASGLYVRDDNLPACAVDPSKPRYVHQYGHRFMFYSKVGNWNKGWYVGETLCEENDKTTLEFNRFTSALTPNLLSYWFSMKSDKTGAVQDYSMTAPATNCPPPVDCLLVSGSDGWPQANGFYKRDDSLPTCTVDPTKPRYVHQNGIRFIFYSKVDNWNKGWYAGSSLCEENDKNTLDFSRFSRALTPNLLSYWFSLDGTKTSAFQDYGISANAVDCLTTVAGISTESTVENTMSTKSTIFTQSTMTSDKIISSESTRSTEVTKSSEATTHIESTMSLDSTTSSESTIFSKSTTSSESTIYSESTQSSETTVSTKGMSSSEASTPMESTVTRGGSSSEDVYSSGGQSTSQINTDLTEQSTMSVETASTDHMPMGLSKASPTTVTRQLETTPGIPAGSTNQIADDIQLTTSKPKQTKPCPSGQNDLMTTEEDKCSLSRCATYVDCKSASNRDTCQQNGVLLHASGWAIVGTNWAARCSAAVQQAVLLCFDEACVEGTGAQCGLKAAHWSVLAITATKLWRVNTELVLYS